MIAIIQTEQQLPTTERYITKIHGRKHNTNKKHWSWRYNI